ncbi:hypothetical protein [Massilia sp. NR 4-1]|nr:hypothetical protein [Massilia sp. NR 4-1]
MNDRTSRNEVPSSVLAELGDYLARSGRSAAPGHWPLIDYCRAD